MNRLMRVALGLGLGLTALIGTTSELNDGSNHRGVSEGKWGDQGNGTYANPIMPGDFSDLDAISVGADFYAISSTFQYSPGIVVLHSRDLVNWAIAGHVLPDITKISPDLNWDRMNRNGRGIWAGSIRYHAGRYWVYFGTPDEGVFMSTTQDVTGSWTPVKQVLAAGGWDDPCPFWDDDEQGYLVATHFQNEPSNGKDYNIHLFKMTADGEQLTPGTDRIIHQSKGSEANKLYKVNGLYYHFYSEVHSEGRVIMMGRARDLYGPWENKQLIHVDPAIDKEPNQGGLLQLSLGAWYFVTHQGTGDWEGRAGVLLPVTWVNGWPIIGAVGPDGIGNIIWRAPKPITGFPKTTLVASDEFASTTLKPEWEWRYQPRVSHWSLTERAGFLRLHSFQPLHDVDFRTAGNVLTQRSLRTSTNEVTVKLELAGLKDGQEAGIAHFAKTFCTLSVIRHGAKLALSYNNNGTRTRGPVVSQTGLWLRSSWGYQGLSQYSYSFDGINFDHLGTSYQLTWGDYRGDRIGIFTFSSTKYSGYVDVDAFHYTIDQ